MSSQPTETTATTSSATGLQKASDAPLDVEALLRGQSLIVIGATGFLGKVWLSLLLDRYPDVGRLFVMVRAKKNMDADTRFWTEIAPSPVFDPIRKKHPGAAYDEFIKSKITPFSGDVSKEMLGIQPDVLEQMKEARPAFVNVAGVVDFNPPLDDALKVNAFGIKNLIATAKVLHDAPVMHTSTCFVVGRRDGLILERNPLEFPFPRADELDRSHWDPENEIAECVDVVDHVRRRVEDAPRQSHLLDEAKQNLKKRGEPLRGPAFEDELSKVKRRFERKKLIEAGKERAEFWGWPNIYTYTKSIGEQVLLNSGLPVVLARPAIVESAVEYPVPGWCEGIQTSTPIMFMAMKGMQGIPCGDHCVYDLIPVDLCAAGMIATLAALLARRNEPVYQYSTGDSNPLKTKRAGQLIGLSKRQRFRDQSPSKNPFQHFLNRYTEPAIMSLGAYQRTSAPAAAKYSKQIASVLGKAKGSPIAGATEPVRKQLEAVGKQYGNISMVVNEFVPFITQFEYRFSAKNTRNLMATLAPADKERLPWNPEAIDWRYYWLETHTKEGFDRWAEPLLEDKLRKETKPQRRHQTLVAMLEDVCDRYDRAIAFQRLEGEELTRVTFRDVELRTRAVAARLAARGIGKEDRVAIGAANHPDWPIAYFGILRAGATAIPLDANYAAEAVHNVLRASEAKAAVFDEKMARPAGLELDVIDLHELTAEPGRDDADPVLPEVEIGDDDVASIIYTSGTTGEPKGVMLTHENFTALVAALAPLFPLRRSDRLLSALPLHHTFEFACGMLLPFSRGSRVIYLDKVEGDRVLTGLAKGQVTNMVGVPALWQALERKIMTEVKDRGQIAESLFDWSIAANRASRRTLGVDLGRLLFGQVHRALGGNLKFMISGGSSLPKDVLETFQGLGLRLSEGYGLTEAAPVLTVAKASPRDKGGHVGKPIPGVEVKIHEPDADGVGEVLARGPNVMLGYADNEDATREVLDDGWLRTGDLGKIDKKGRLQIVGRSKDVIVTSAGENIYPDDVENMLGTPDHVQELSVVGIPDGKGNELVALLAVPDPEYDKGLDHAQLHSRARADLRNAVNDLPLVMRPSVIHLTDTALPRTATRKVKRPEVRKFITRLENAATALKKVSGAGTSAVVREAVASIARIDASKVRPELNLITDLGFDSLMVAELATALESHMPHASPDQVSQVATVADLEGLVQAEHTPVRHRSTQIEKEEDDDSITVPEFVKDAVRPVAIETQFSFYRNVMRTKVTGRGYIPQNRQVLVIANHASHLDAGLVKYALGNYGKEVVSLAAQDYFFSDKWRRLYFENFTHMAPLDRKSGLRKALRQAGDLLDGGRSVLIFPEGTRSKDGNMAPFMPLIGHLSINHNVDILPIYLDGTFKALPKGAKIPVPRTRKLAARIGPPLRHQDLVELTEGKKRVAIYREVAKLAQEAVEALRDGGVVDLQERLTSDAPAAPRKSALTMLMEDLTDKFVPGSVDKETSFYFSLGTTDDAKWTLVFDAEKVHIRPGKPEGGTADCVLKTNRDIFTRIVRESYTPSVAEFMSGQVKSNDIGLLQVFQKAFDL